MKQYVCLICGFVYDENTGHPESHIHPQTPFADIDASWVCPECHAPKEDFELVEF